MRAVVESDEGGREGGTQLSGREREKGEDQTRQPERCVQAPTGLSIHRRDQCLQRAAISATAIATPFTSLGAVA